MSVVGVVCCQVEVSATGRSLVQGSPTECMCVCARVIERIHVQPSTVRSECRCVLRLRYIDLVKASIDARGHYFKHLL
jgi:hypothetical protein